MTAPADNRCGWCGYLLGGLGVRGRCPECGECFDLIRKPRCGGQPLSASELASRFTPSARTVAIILLVLGAGGTLAWTGWGAVERLREVLARLWM